MATKEVRNLQTLNKQAYQLKFDLEGSGYEPIENIGCGAYGVVCSAICKKTEERVAIKKISPAFDHIETWKSTYREIRILKHFKHDNVISIREILKPKTDNFKDIQIVLDFMESDLHKIIHTQELTDEHIRYFLYQILRGLKYIHSANVIHRDLKPSNLLVNENCALKIADFGMARVMACSSRETNYSMTQYVATRWYRAPELIISDGEYTFSVDLWSVGCILAEMLGQKVLFKGENPSQQLSLIVRKCGTPSKQCLEKFPKYIVQPLTKTHHEPVKWASEFPNAHRKSLDILGKLLRFDPCERINAEVCLKHPYLSKYHEPQDEPVCDPPLGADFEGKISATDQLRRLITDEIMSYHRPPDFGIPNLKPVPVEQVKQFASMKHSLSSESAIPQLSPRTTGLASFLQLQKKLQNNDSRDNSAFKKPFPAVIQSNVISSTDVEMPSAKPAQESTIQADLKPADSSASVNNELSSTTISTKESSSEEQKSQQQQHPDDAVQDDPQHSHSNDGASQVGQNSSKTSTSLATKQRIRDAILKGQTKQRPVSVEPKPKPNMAYERRKEKERKREIMEARRKSRLKEQKADAEMSSMDLDMLARWEQMQKKRKEQLDVESQPPRKKAAPDTSEQSDRDTCTKENNPTNATTGRGADTETPLTTSPSAITGSTAGATILTNLGGPVLSTGLNITQNVYIPFPNVTFIPAATGSVLYMPDVQQISPVVTAAALPGQTQTVTYSLPNNQAPPVVVVRDNATPFAQTIHQTSGEPVAASTLMPKVVTPQNIVRNLTLPFATYQTLPQPAMISSNQSLGRSPSHLNTQSPGNNSSKDSLPAVQLPKPAQTLVKNKPGNSQKMPSVHKAKDKTETLNKEDGGSSERQSKDACHGEPVSLCVKQQESVDKGGPQVQPTVRRLSWQDQDDCETLPVGVPFSTPATSHTSTEKPGASEPLNLKLDATKMKINTNVQPSSQVIVLTPKRGPCAVSIKVDTKLSSAANNDINSGTTESAPASGLTRDWQQAINMDPKDLEELLRGVQTELPSPRFVLDLMGQNQQ